MVDYADLKVAGQIGQRFMHSRGTCVAFRDNWPRHLFAPLMGGCFSEPLARDFSVTGEDLWDAEKPIFWRWAKLLYAYVLSALAQVTFPALIACAVIALWNGSSFHTFWLSVLISTGVALLVAILMTIVVCLEVKRQRRHGK